MTRGQQGPQQRSPRSALSAESSRAPTTEGLELTWGNAAAFVALLEKMARREGIGDILADGVKRAAERIGRGAEAYAMHIHGAELPMHDPKFQPGLATTYKMDATPARHTQGHEDMPPLIEGWPTHDKYRWGGKGELHKKCSELVHVVNAAGLCLFSYMSYDWRFVPEFLSAVTGWPIDTAECHVIGERIANVRHAFNLREGLNPIEFEVPRRALGDPPQTQGNLRGITVDLDTQVREYCMAMDGDPTTAVPSRARLELLGLADGRGTSTPLDRLRPRRPFEIRLLGGSHARADDGPGGITTYAHDSCV